MTKIKNFIDADFEPLAEDKVGPQMGLVVGPKLTEKEFEEKWGGARRRDQRAIEFEDEDGSPMTGTPGIGTD